MAPLLYTFYGDDFTGSTDVLEQLATGGVRSALFLQPPTPEDLALVPGLQAFGIAGESRSHSPAWMRVHLPGLFESLRSFGAPLTQYKVCSTFDSSPERGSIGCALEIGKAVFPSQFVPVVIGAPHLRRFVYEGKLFAADPSGLVQRIDGHPMSRHPVTPMREPDLCRHLQAQTSTSVCGVQDVASEQDLRHAVACRIEKHCETLMFDTVTTGDLERVGMFLWAQARQQPMFAVGSSGLTAALLSAWRASGVITAAESTPYETTERLHSDVPAPLLVISGSCSAATERQLRWAEAHGFAGTPLDPALLLDRERGLRACEAAIAFAKQRLKENRDVMLYTAMGTPSGAVQGAELGAALGALLKDVLRLTPVRRVLLCGGDTSSHAVQQLGLRALTWLANVQPGAPLCRGHGDGLVNGLELVLKGGQMGGDDFFAAVRDKRVSQA